METGKIGLIEEAPGQKSVMRLVFLVGMIWAMALITYIIYLKAYKVMVIGLGELGIFAGIIFGVFTTLKLWQKSEENNTKKIEMNYDPNKLIEEKTKPI
jgi:hypothetical protein